MELPSVRSQELSYINIRCITSKLRWWTAPWVEEIRVRRDATANATRTSEIEDNDWSQRTRTTTPYPDVEELSTLPR